MIYEIIEYENNDFTITTDNSKIDIEVISSLISKTYWANIRPKDVIIKSLKNSLCFSLFYKQTQIGLIRVITDCATFAYLCDVIIDEKYRKNGLGKWMLECVFQYPELKNLKRWCLITKDAHEFYKKLGFHNLDNPEIYGNT
jgi:N-acetylglutamate synthase-like GNAT family acetyltransferase